MRRAYEKLTPNEAEILNKNMDYFEFSVDDIANPQMGKIAQVFGSGGCILILLV